MRGHAKNAGSLTDPEPFPGVSTLLDPAVGAIEKIHLFPLARVHDYNQHIYFDNPPVFHYS